MSLSRWIALLLLTAGLFGMCTSARAEAYDVYIVTGQSNSLGTTRFDGEQAQAYGPGEADIDKEIAFLWSNVHASNKTYPPKLYGDSGGEIVSLQMQQGDGGKNPAFWGPEFGFGRAIASQSANKVLIIKASRGGGGNTYWDKDAYTKDKNAGHMWQHLCDTVDAGLDVLVKRGDSFTVKGLLYIQGESNNAKEAGLAGQRLTDLHANLQDHLNAQYNNTADSMKLVVGEIAASQNAKARKQTTQEQKEEAESDPSFVFVKTRDLPLQPDNIHFGKRAKLEIGKRIAKAFQILKLIDQQCQIVAQAQNVPQGSRASNGGGVKGDRLNILFIVSEDNSDHLGCYGDKTVLTPALDSLAERGVRYARAYVPYPVCSPSRAIFLTGLYSRQTGHIGLATHKFAMYKDFKTMPAYFREAGYYTGFLGKTHVNPARVVEDFIDHRAIPQANFGKATSIKKYAEEARKVMENAQAADKPFLLIINYADAHRRFINESNAGFPTKQEKETIEPYPWIGSDSPGLRDQILAYRNCMNRLDEGVGMVLKDLDELKLRDNTLIIYMADHGADFPRGKASVYENGVRVPMIVSYPKAFPQGKVENHLVSSIDILPTMLEQAGLDVPEHLSGHTLQDIGAGKAERKYIHSFTTGSAPSIHYLQFGIRDDRYKLIWNPYRTTNRLAVSRYKYIPDLPKAQWVQGFVKPPEYELYDLDSDPHEWVNLADRPEHQQIKSELILAMKQFQQRIHDPFLERENLDAFEAEQVEHQRINYRRQKNFRWPHLDLFGRDKEG